MTTTEESGLLAHARRELDIVDPPGDAAYDTGPVSLAGMAAHVRAKETTR